MSALVEATARKLSVERTGYAYDLLLEEQQLALKSEVRPVIEASGVEELFAILKEAFSLHENGELCRGDMLRAEWASKAEAVIAEATGKEAA